MNGTTANVSIRYRANAMAPLIHYLGQVLFEAREDAGISRERLAAMNPDAWTTNSLFRLEKGKNANYWPRDPEGMVTLYATATGRDPLDLWDEALTRKRSGKSVEEYAAKRRVRRASKSRKARREPPAQAPPKNG